MSKYDEIHNDSEMICPYCGESYQPETEDYSEDPDIVECYSCEKKYYAVQAFSVTHISIPDCELIGKSHKWEAHKYNNGYVLYFCENCPASKQREKSPTEKSMEELIAESVLSN